MQKKSIYILKLYVCLHNISTFGKNLLYLTTLLVNRKKDTNYNDVNTHEEKKIYVTMCM